MDRIINVKVGGNHLSKDNKNAGVKGEANVTYLRITFDEGWDGYAKTVTFFDALGGNPVKRIETVDLIEDITTDARTYITPIPKEPLTIAGEMTFIIDGYLDGKRQRSIADKLVVKDAPNTDTAGEPTDPTPTEPEQWQTQIDKIMDDIQQVAISKEETAGYAEDARGSADYAGFLAQNAQNNEIRAFNYANEAAASAEKAETAIKHEPTIIDGYWHTWNATNKQYEDTGVKAQAGSVVYLGDSPPADADVWIDPEGESAMLEIKNYIDEQTEILKSDVEGLQAQINEEAHFRGYVSTNAKIQSLNATPNDFAYSAESGTKWVYDAENGWIDTGKPVPDQLTPASETTPLINGVASVGQENAYARGDHRHPTDTTRASVEQLNELTKRVTTNEEIIIDHENRISTNEEVISQNRSDIIALEDKDEEIERVLASCEKLEHISSVTLTEEVAQISPTLNGRYKEIYWVFDVRAEPNTTKTEKGRLFLFPLANPANTGATKLIQQTSALVSVYKSTDWRLWISVKVVGGYAYSELWWDSSLSADSAYGAVPDLNTNKGIIVPFRKLTKDYIDELSLWMGSADNSRVFPAGTTYELWGVKAE